MFNKKELELIRYFLVHFLVAPHTGHYTVKDIEDAMKLHKKIQEEING